MNKNILFKSIIIISVIICLLLAGCNFLKGVIPGTDNTEEESINLPDSAGTAEFVEKEVLIKVKPGADVEKIVSELGGTIIEMLPQVSVIRVKLKSGVTVAESIKTLEALKEVEYAEPNGLCYMHLAPNDSNYGSQWAPQLTGAESAWDITTGAAGVIIAITDTGVDGTHPDFGGKVIAGYDTFNDISISANTNSSVQYHGTHCAGIAAAVGNNSQGMAGVAWGSTIMPIKIADDGPDYSANDFDMAQAFTWAADSGANIISCSFGGKSYSQTMKDAIDYAVIDMGCAMVASMGNSSRNETMYPAGYQSVIAVGATNAHDEIADFSTTGNHMSVCAPGVEIYSTMPGGGYDYLGGTSMACPFVSGAAALILSHNPGMSPEGVKTQLEDTAVDLGSPGFDSTYGHGRVDLAAALGAPVANKYGMVDVLVNDQLGNPLPGASVILWQGGIVISTTNSSDDGHAKFEYIQASEYGISVSFPGFDSCLAADNSVIVAAGEEVSTTIAFTTAEVYDVSACAESTNVEGEEHAIYVEWHSYPDASGYNIYRSVNGVENVVYQKLNTSEDWYVFWDYDVSEINSYTYYVTAYGDGWETDPSQIVTIDTWLPYCSLTSPIDESNITTPTPTFTWSPEAPVFPYYSLYSGSTCMLVYDLDTSDFVWLICFDDPTTSTATYDQDGQADSLISGHSYTWHSWTSGYDENGNRIAVSESQHWNFDYSGN